ncbi:MAG: exosortase system-associated protein, TIGR04073 family [Candidatus Omnitrophica bacterium]|nr:exosortase system-associated protein, TIGR04073 family [Candidatus Omnitrophota bacterium]
MKKAYLIACSMMFVLLSMSSAYSIDTIDLGASPEEIAARKAKEAEKPALINTADMSKTYGKTPFNKLTRGVFNMSTFYFEIPAGAMRVAKEKDNYFIGGTVGTAQGFFACILRAVTGVFDTVTFIIPPYNRPVMNPEYAVQSLEEAQP